MFQELSDANVQRLTKNTYPGRGMIIGMSKDQQKMVMVYWLMGRSENSRNRIFVEEGDGIRTQAKDPAKLTDPSLIIYWPFRQLSSTYILTNGDQTDTLYQFMNKDKSFEEALNTREFEPDAPNYTPRISCVCDIKEGKASYKLSILKSFQGQPDYCIRAYYHYQNPIPGFGHCIHTYENDGNPIPSFTGEPYLLNLKDTASENAEYFWNMLNTDNRVSLFAKMICCKDGSVETKMINL